VLGSTAARSFLGPRFNAARGRGKLHRTPWAPVWLATYHPSAALRSLTPADRERALAGLREDLRLAAAQLHALDPSQA
jgi:DNA polymerase